MGVGHCKTSSVGHQLSGPPAVVSSDNFQSPGKVRETEKLVDRNR